MTPGLNPYQSPRPVVSTESHDERLKRRPIDRFVLTMWPPVFFLNLIVPAFFGWEITREGGRLGVLAATTLLLISGWWVFSIQIGNGRRVVLGAAILSLSQLFPVIQMVAGLVALAIFGFTIHDDGSMRAMSETGGFLVTFVVGLLLISLAAIIGVGLSLLLPHRWFTISQASNETRILD